LREVSGKSGAGGDVVGGGGGGFEERADLFDIAREAVEAEGVSEGEVVLGVRASGGGGAVEEGHGLYRIECDAASRPITHGEIGERPRVAMDSGLLPQLGGARVVLLVALSVVVADAQRELSLRVAGLGRDVHTYATSRSVPNPTLQHPAARLRDTTSLFRVFIYHITLVLTRDVCGNGSCSIHICDV
jgi:hypothetical protein